MLTFLPKIGFALGLAWIAFEKNKEVGGRLKSLFATPLKKQGIGRPA